MTKRLNIGQCPHTSIYFLKQILQSEDDRLIYRLILESSFIIDEHQEMTWSGYIQSNKIFFFFGNVLFICCRVLVEKI